MSRLTPCPICHNHVLVSEQACPHCGAVLRSSSNPAMPLMIMSLGLSLVACRAEPEYGVPDTDSTESDSSGETTGTDSGTSTESTGTDAEPEYGVPDTGVDTGTSTDTQGSTDAEPDYGVPDTGSTDSTSSTT